MQEKTSCKRTNHMVAGPRTQAGRIMASRPEHMPPWQTWGWKMMVSRPEHIRERKDGKLQKRGMLQYNKQRKQTAAKRKRRKEKDELQGH